MAKEKEITSGTMLFHFKDIEAAEMFYKLKKLLRLTTSKQCNELLIAMSQLGLMKRVQKTSRTPDQVTADFKKNGFNVLDQRVDVKDGGTKGWDGKLKRHPPTYKHSKLTVLVLIIMIVTLSVMLIPYFNS